MTIHGLLRGETPSLGLGPLPMTTRARFAWTLAELAGVRADAPADQTASLSSGPAGLEPAPSGGEGRSLSLAETGVEPVEQAMSDTDRSDAPEGVVASLVLLGVTFTIGGLAGFLLAVLVR